MKWTPPASGRTPGQADGYGDRMAAFNPNASLDADLAFRLMDDTFVRMFWSEDLLADALGWLTQHGYQIVEVDAGNCADTGALLDGLAVALNFPAYFGRNLNAFNDC